MRGQTGIHHIYKFVLRPAAADGHGNGNGHGLPANLRETTLNVAIAPLVSKDQEQIGRLIIFDDVTSRDELERRLIELGFDGIYLDKCDVTDDLREHFKAAARSRSANARTRGLSAWLWLRKTS